MLSNIAPRALPTTTLHLDVQPLVAEQMIPVFECVDTLLHAPDMTQVTMHAVMSALPLTAHAQQRMPREPSHAYACKPHISRSS